MEGNVRKEAEFEEFGADEADIDLGRGLGDVGLARDTGLTDRIVQ